MKTTIQWLVILFCLSAKQSFAESYKVFFGIMGQEQPVGTATMTYGFADGDPRQEGNQQSITIDSTFFSLPLLATPQPMTIEKVLESLTLPELLSQFSGELATHENIIQGYAPGVIDYSLYLTTSGTTISFHIYARPLKVNNIQIELKLEVETLQGKEQFSGVFISPLDMKRMRDFYQFPINQHNYLSDQARSLNLYPASWVPAVFKLAKDKQLLPLSRGRSLPTLPMTPEARIHTSYSSFASAPLAKSIHFIPARHTISGMSLYFAKDTATQAESLYGWKLTGGRYSLYFAAEKKEDKTEDPKQKIDEGQQAKHKEKTWEPTDKMAPRKAKPKTSKGTKRTSRSDKAVYVALQVAKYLCPLGSRYLVNKGTSADISTVYFDYACDQMTNTVSRYWFESALQE